mmetsp:Transcript_16449/g.26051  ORF Transcript_16449/g.26051 Transcript_16449/m.26051 type:complete len:314 (-) Transcript_16449:1539-2480(-)
MGDALGVEKRQGTQYAMEDICDVRLRHKGLHSLAQVEYGATVTELHDHPELAVFVWTTVALVLDDVRVCLEAEEDVCLHHHLLQCGVPHHILEYLNHARWPVHHILIDGEVHLGESALANLGRFLGTFRAHFVVAFFVRTHVEEHGIPICLHMTYCAYSVPTCFPDLQGHLVILRAEEFEMLLKRSLPLEIALHPEASTDVHRHCNSAFDFLQISELPVPPIEFASCAALKAYDALLIFGHEPQADGESSTGEGWTLRVCKNFGKIVHLEHADLPACALDKKTTFLHPRKGESAVIIESRFRKYRERGTAIVL